ncbi:MAG: SGNH/GDSL hydrolase family protein [Thermomicrobiales bacterium]
MIFERGQKVVFIGDSITDAGRRTDPLVNGTGYFNLVRSFVLARYPELGLEIVNRGIGGDTVRHLEARWAADVIAEKPDWLSVKIGINDVWRTFDREGEGAVGIEDYESIYRTLLTRAVDETGTNLILADPYIIESDRSDLMRLQMDAYGEVVGKLADEFGAIRVRTQVAFDRVLMTTGSGAWAADRIHPGTPGHAVIALEYLKAIGFDLGE